MAYNSALHLLTWGEMKTAIFALRRRFLKIVISPPAVDNPNVFIRSCLHSSFLTHHQVQAGCVEVYCGFAFLRRTIAAFKPFSQTCPLSGMLESFDYGKETIRMSRKVNPRLPFTRRDDLPLLGNLIPDEAINRQNNQVDWFPGGLVIPFAVKRVMMLSPSTRISSTSIFMSGFLPTISWTILFNPANPGSKSGMPGSCSIKSGVYISSANRSIACKSFLLTAENQRRKFSTLWWIDMFPSNYSKKKQNNQIISLYNGRTSKSNENFCYQDCHQ